MHAADLRDRHVALVDDAKHVLGKIIDQRKRRLTGLATVQMPRIVLDSIRESHGLEHLEVVVASLLQALRLKKFVLGLKLGDALLALFSDALESSFYLGLLSHVVRGRPYRDGLVFAQDLAGNLIDLSNKLNLVAKELKAQRMLGIRRIDIDDIPAHTERSARQVVIVSIVLDIDERMDEVVALERNLLIDVRSEARIVLGRTDAVDARYRRDDDHIASRKKRRRRLMAQHFDFLVNGGVLFDIRIALRNIGFRLVIVVVAYKINHGVMREKLFELARELGSKRFVGSHNERRLFECLDGLCHGEGLAGTGDSQKNLIAVALLHAFNEARNCLWLVSRRLEWRYNLKSRLRVLYTKAFKLATDAFDLKSRHGTSRAESTSFKSRRIELHIACIGIVHARQISLSLGERDRIAKRRTLLRPVIDVTHPGIIGGNRALDGPVEVLEQIRKISAAEFDVGSWIRKVTHVVRGPVNKVFRNHIACRFGHELHESLSPFVGSRRGVPI